MSFCEIQEPPRKKQKISSNTSISPDNNENDSNETKEQATPDEPYYYSLHIEPDIILVSTDPEVPCNTNFNIEFNTNSKPNLFIVKKTDSTYNESEWLNYHSNKTNDILNACNLLSNNNLPLLIVTGAGMGCDSNLPDYRSPGGFWNDYKPLLNIKNNNKLSLYEMSKTDWFNTMPLLAWGFYTHRAKLYRNAIPHIGFNILYNLSVNTNRNYFYMTSNIDGQAIKAGFKKNKLIQTHGSLHHLQCLNYCENSNIIPFLDGYNDLKMNKETFMITDMKYIPNCDGCNGLMRPNVSFFSDTQDTFNGERIIKQKERLMEWLNEFMNDKKELLVVEIGCGKSIHSLRWECEYLKSLENVKLIRINPTEQLDMNKNHNNKNHIILKLTAKTALNAIDNYIKKNIDE
eukprot:29004_1